MTNAFQFPQHPQRVTDEQANNISDCNMAELCMSVVDRRVIIEGCCFGEHEEHPDLRILVTVSDITNAGIIVCTHEDCIEQRNMGECAHYVFYSVPEAIAFVRQVEDLAWQAATAQREDHWLP